MSSLPLVTEPSLKNPSASTKTADRSMSQQQINHVFCVPFHGAGHAINMLNVAHVLGDPHLQVHVLVLSLAAAQTWMKATGQSANSNVHFVSLASGKWETWTPAEPRDIVTLSQSPEFNAAVDEAVSIIEAQFPNDKCTGMVINGLMAGLAGVCKAQHMKLYLLSPVPYYMTRLNGLQDEKTTPQTPYTLKGIADSPGDLHGEIGDVIDFLGPMYHKMFKPTVLVSDGQIYSNTNTGLEGRNYKQPQLPDNDNIIKNIPSYLIGPILPPLYARALDDPAALQAQLALADPNDEVINFLNAQPPKSVVYVALGSHTQMSLSQALLLLKLLRKYKTRFVLLYREKLPALLESLNTSSTIFSDGVITSWAPQLQVLIHPATKLVLSHGGFGTMIEGVFAGQVFLTSPVTSDQFINSRVMRHLGIALGTVGENHYLSVLQRKELVPLWGTDQQAEQRWDALFMEVLGSDGERVLEKARLASLALRARMIAASQYDGVAETQRLKADITTLPLELA